jgi:hypothetical protein
MAPTAAPPYGNAARPLNGRGRCAFRRSVRRFWAVGTVLPAARRCGIPTPLARDFRPARLAPVQPLKAEPS